MLKSLVLQNRSYRAFDESAPIGEETMRALVELARKVGSGMNRQPLRYRILCDKADISTMRANCRFASKLPVKLPPANGKPTGFILLFIDREAGSPASLALKDVGIAAQTILLGATEKGFGGCMLGSFNPEQLRTDFGISARYEPALAIALGKPAEPVVLTEAADGNLDYYRDEAGTHYVPKRAAKDIYI